MGAAAPWVHLPVQRSRIPSLYFGDDGRGNGGSLGRDEYQPRLPALPGAISGSAEGFRRGVKLGLVERCSARSPVVNGQGEAGNGMFCSSS